MDMSEAKAIGYDKLRLHPKVLEKAAYAAQEMGVRREDMPVMILALGIMGVARAVKPEDLEGELTDALALVAQAEREWRMEQAIGKGLA